MHPFSEELRHELNELPNEDDDVKPSSSWKFVFELHVTLNLTVGSFVMVQIGFVVLKPALLWEPDVDVKVIAGLLLMNVVPTVPLTVVRSRMMPWPVPSEA